MCGYLLDDDLNCPECEVCNPTDEVNHPSHYTTGGIECIDAMKAMMEVLMYPRSFRMIGVQHSSTSGDGTTKVNLSKT